ncbi:MAG: hypothetical protein ABUJ98_13830 [Hyphomicrobium sp.]
MDSLDKAINDLGGKEFALRAALRNLVAAAKRPSDILDNIVKLNLENWDITNIRILKQEAAEAENVLAAAVTAAKEVLK